MRVVLNFVMANAFYWGFFCHYTHRQVPASLLFSVCFGYVLLLLSEDKD